MNDQGPTSSPSREVLSRKSSTYKIVKLGLPELQSRSRGTTANVFGKLPSPRSNGETLTRPLKSSRPLSLDLISPSRPNTRSRPDSTSQAYSIFQASITPYLTSSLTAPSFDDERNARSSRHSTSFVNKDRTLPYSTATPGEYDTPSSPTPDYTTPVGTFNLSCYTSPQAPHSAEHHPSNVPIPDYSIDPDLKSDPEDWSSVQESQTTVQIVSGFSTTSHSASTSPTGTPPNLARASSILDIYNQERCASFTPGPSSSPASDTSSSSFDRSDRECSRLSSASPSPTLCSTPPITDIHDYFPPIDIDLDQEELDICSTSSFGRSYGNSTRVSTPVTSPKSISSSPSKDRLDVVEGFDTDSVYQDLKLPFRAAIHQAEYSVTRERPQDLIVSSTDADAMAPTQQQTLQPGRKLSNRRRCVHQRFAALVEADHGTVISRKPARTTDNDFKIRHKGRFVQHARRRKHFRQRRRRARTGTPPAQPVRGDTTLTATPVFRPDLNLGRIVQNARPMGGINRADPSPYASAPVRAPVFNFGHAAYIRRLHYLAAYFSAHPPRLAEGCTFVDPFIKPEIDTLHLRSINLYLHFKNSRTRHDLITDKLVLLTPTNHVSSLQLAQLGLTTSQVGCAQIPDHVARCRTALRELDERSRIYFDALEMELMTGCRCVRFVRSPDGTITPRSPGPEPAETLPRSCYCGKWLSDLNDDGITWRKEADTGPYPSRIKPLIIELQSMLKLVMPLGLRPQNHPSPSGDNVTRQSVANTPVFYSSDSFFEEIDPAFLVNRVRNGDLDWKIFRRLAKSMKSYCAPVRDDDVDEMAAFGDEGDAVDALKSCFKILVQMRIDFVNMELMKEVPWLKDTAIHHELASFERALDYEGVLLEDSDTRSWILSASQRVLDEADREQTSHLLGQCHCNNRTELVIRSIVEGVCLLIFANWSAPDKCDWKILSGVQPRPREQGSNFMPESMRKDTNRLHCFSVEARVIAAEATILATFQEVLSLHRGNLSRNEEAQVIRLRDTIMKTHRKLCQAYYTQLTAPPGENPLAFLNNVNGSEPSWADSSRAFDLRPSTFVTELAICLCFPHRFSNYNKPGTYHYTPAEKTELIGVAHELVSRLEINMRVDSPVFATCLGNLRTLITERLTSTLWSMRLTEFRAMFPAAKSDCFLATLPLLKEIDVQPNMLKLGKFAYERIDADHNRYISETHIERWSIAWTHHNYVADRKLADKLNLTALDGRLLDFSQQILQMMHLHLRVYRDIYLGTGMLTRSGSLSVFDKKQGRSRRKAANFRNAALTECPPRGFMRLTDPSAANCTCIIQ